MNIKFISVFFKIFPVFFFLLSNPVISQNFKNLDKEAWKSKIDQEGFKDKILFYPKKYVSLSKNVNFDSYSGIDGHAGGVNCIAINKSGSLIASCGNDGTIRIFDAVSGNNVNNLFGHSAGVSSIAFSPDGLKLASGSFDNTIKIWDINSGNLIRTLTGHTEQVNAVAFSPDGTKLASASGGFPDFFGENDYTVKLWDINSGTLIRSYTGHTCLIYSVAFSPDGTKIASSAGSEEFFFQIFDNSIKIWDVNNGALLKTLKGHTSDVVSVSFSPDGSKILSGDMGGKIKVWEAASGSLSRTISAHSRSITSVVFSPDGTKFSSGSSDTTTKLWETATGSFIRTFKAHTKEVNTICFSPDGMKIYSGSNDNSIKGWTINSGSLLNSFLSKHNIKMNSALFSTDSKNIITAGDEQNIKIWEAKTFNETLTMKGHTSNILFMAISNDGKKLASAGYDNKIKIWNYPEGSEILTISGSNSTINSLAFSKDGSILISGSSDNLVKIWDTKTGNLLKTLSDHKNYVYSVAFSPDGTKFASAGGSQDHAIRLWDASNFTLIGSLAGHAVGTNFIAFSPDGKKIVSIGNDETIKLWNLSDNSLSATLIGHTEYPNAIAFSIDGSILASAGKDGTINLWDLNKGSITRKILYDHGFANSLSFSPDGEKIAAAGWGYKNIRTYNLKTKPASINISDTLVNFIAVQNDRKPDPKTFKIANKGELELNWSISDDAAWLDINPVNGKDSSVITLSVNNTSMTPGSYSANITITASAADNNPGTVKVIYILRPAYPSTLNLSKTIEFISRTNTADYKPTDYRIIGIPGKGDISVKDFFTGTQGIDWQVFYDNGNDTNYFKEYDGTSDFLFTIGNAFWILKKDAFTINKTVSSAPLNSNYEAEIALHKGWNLITNPFADAIAWPKIAILNKISDSIWKFTGNFEFSSSFDPFTGYYFDNTSNLSKLRVPFLSQVYSTGMNKEKSEDGWRIKISLLLNGITKGSVLCGVSTGASVKYDKYDFRKPRIFGNVTEIYFNRQSWGKNYAQLGSDIRPFFESYDIWDFEIRNIQPQSCLIFTELKNLPKEFKAYLFDFVNGKYQDLLKDSIYKINYNSSISKYSVYIGKEEYFDERRGAVSLPVDYSILSYPNPFNPKTNIRISLPEDCFVKLGIYDFLGRNVKSIHEGFLVSGRYDFEWNGKNEDNKFSSSGIYFCTLKTGSGKFLVQKLTLIR